MSGGFTHDIAGGQGNLVIASLQSPNFVHGVSGWQISKDGNAEFNQVQARGQVFVSGTGGSEIAILLNLSGFPIIELIPASVIHQTLPPEVFSVSFNAGLANESMQLVMTSGKESGHDDAALQLFSAPADASAAASAVIEFGGTVAATFTKANVALAGPVQPGGQGTGAHIYSGTGAPAISATGGDMYIRADGSAGSYLYACTGGSSWTAFA